MPGRKKKTRSRRQALLLGSGFAASTLALIIVLVFTASTLDAYFIRSGGLGAAVITSELVDLTNTNRLDNNLSELTVSPALVAIAQAKANDMAEKGYFAHVSPNGEDPWYWFKQGGYSFAYAGENLAVDFTDSQSVEQAWMNSPTHRANILDINYTQIGIATAVGMYEGHTATFVVQEFGTPALAPTPPIQEVTPLNQPTVTAVATTQNNTQQVLGASSTATVPPTRQPTQVKQIATTNTEKSKSSTSTVSSKTLSTGIAADTTPQAPMASFWDILITSPKSVLLYSYYFFAALIFVALIFETGLEIRRHHARHLSIALGLLVFMVGSFFFAQDFVFTSPQITQTAAAFDAVSQGSIL